MQIANRTISNGKSRLEFLDCLRFFAALSVIIQHIFERVSPSFGWFSSNYFQFGAYGVTLFFLTSGFIIPVSLEKYKSLKKFWIGRIFRLYPLFLLSLIIKLVYIFASGYQGMDINAVTVLANISMLAKFMGIPLIEGLYWTLNLEMAFYIAVSGLFIIGLLRRSLLVAYGALGFSILIGVIGSGVLHLFEGGWLMVFYLATMFVGTVFYRKMKGDNSFYALALLILVAVLVLFANTFLNLYNNASTGSFGGKSFWPVTNAVLAAYLTFALFFHLRHFSYPKPFVYFGAISYSLYLNQAIIITLVMSNVNNPFLSASLAVVLIFMMSHITYRAVELPFVNLGRRFIKPKIRADFQSNGIFHHTKENTVEPMDVEFPKRQV